MIGLFWSEPTTEILAGAVPWPGLRAETLPGFLVRVRRAVDTAWAQRAAERLVFAHFGGELSVDELATMLRILGVESVSVFLRPAEQVPAVDQERERGERARLEGERDRALQKVAKLERLVRAEREYHAAEDAYFEKLRSPDLHLLELADLTAARERVHRAIVERSKASADAEGTT